MAKRSVWKRLKLLVIQAKYTMHSRDSICYFQCIIIYGNDWSDKNFMVRIKNIKSYISNTCYRAIVFGYRLCLCLFVFECEQKAYVTCAQLCETEYSMHGKTTAKSCVCVRNPIARYPRSTGHWHTREIIIIGGKMRTQGDEE